MFRINRVGQLSFSDDFIVISVSMYSKLSTHVHMIVTMSYKLSRDLSIIFDSGLFFYVYTENPSPKNHRKPYTTVQNRINWKDQPQKTQSKTPKPQPPKPPLIEQKREKSIKN